MSANTHNNPYVSQPPPEHHVHRDSEVLPGARDAAASANYDASLTNDSQTWKDNNQRQFGAGIDDCNVMAGGQHDTSGAPDSGRNAFNSERPLDASGVAIGGQANLPEGKATITDKLIGKTQKVTGKITRNPDMHEKGELLYVSTSRYGGASQGDAWISFDEVVKAAIELAFGSHDVTLINTAEEFCITLRKMGSIDSDGVDASGVGEARISSEGYLCRHDASRKLVCHIGCIRAHIIGLFNVRGTSQYSSYYRYVSKGVFCVTALHLIHSYSYAYTRGKPSGQSARHLLLGGICATAQIYSYWLQYPDDSKIHRGTVGAVWFIDTIHTAFCLVVIYHYIIIDYGNIRLIENMIWHFLRSAGLGFTLVALTFPFSSGFRKLHPVELIQSYMINTGGLTARILGNCVYLYANSFIATDTDVQGHMLAGDVMLASGIQDNDSTALSVSNGNREDTAADKKTPILLTTTHGDGTDTHSEMKTELFP
ncbi:hypothetical protein POSPLADRAFT_1044230 [Postia placenta MAD-698-R-SB12]|uniref:Uncharacterized protein n=1 Tax=Postia placenta MAD-698-R-SB12 TaxID=670580 RepID=A0A1X6N817_9APHY|nr:hypothetical protein POSPLADRAFT_1044230 [Postia placenta MAD-698-R-SB12]OSX64775.1 hypothetical protein POSPLADRAFT_1044230 [Postia placenta MAD-698-R-SB12]